MPDLHPNAFSINIYLPHGEPDGLRIVGRTNWTGCGLVFKRSGFPSAMERAEFQKTGVYILVGTVEDSSQPMLYIGEGEVLAARLQSHQAQKDFWTWCVSFVTNDDSLNKAHVRYLEHRLLQLAKDSKQARLDNTITTSEPNLSEPEQAAMESFLGDILNILPLVGLSAFEQPDTTAKPDVQFHFKGLGMHATGYEGPQGFIVEKGSQAAAREVRSIHNFLRTLRRDLLDQGVLVPRDDHLVFTQNHAFSSPSTAAGVVRGGNANGRIDWKTADGRTLKDLQTEAAGESYSSRSP